MKAKKPTTIKTYFSYQSRAVQIGKLWIGGTHPVAVQSMTNTNTLDTEVTAQQVMALADAGCDIVRITAPGTREAANLEAIKNKLAQKGYEVPLVADIHFNPKAAEVAAGIVEKIRINPGNYVDRNRGKVDWSDREIREARERIAERLFPLIGLCEKNNTAIRIGTNHGSLAERILWQFGNTPEGMVESAMEFVRIVRSFGFHNLVLSIKASNFISMTRANILLVEKMTNEGFYNPLHLGVTEAGNGDEARIKSAAGIGSLLVRGLGDTIRVSLAEDPLNEVPFGKMLVDKYARKENKFSEITTGTSLVIPASTKTLKEITGVKNPVVSDSEDANADMFFINKKLITVNPDGTHKAYDIDEKPYKNSDQTDVGRVIFRRAYPPLAAEELLCETAVDFGLIFSEHNTGGIWLAQLSVDSSGSIPHMSSKALTNLSLKILQGLGLRYSKAEFIACPSCGRTQFDLFSSFEKVKARTAHLKGLKIAVMGCIVNGPGEMADADYGYVGAGLGNVTLYKNREPVLKSIKQSQAVDALIDLIKAGGDWSESK